MGHDHEHSHHPTGMLAAMWQGIDATRRFVVNLLFIAILVALLVLAFRGDEPEIADTTALVVAPQGQLVEQLAARTVERMIDEARGTAAPETLVKDVVDAIRAARDDDRVKVLVLDLGAFDGARLTKLQDVRDAVRDFKTSGKQVVATADAYAQDAYYLAAFADEVWVNEMGMVLLEGYGRYRMYYKEGIDKLGLDVHVFRVGEYKSYVEPYLRDDMSPEAREADAEWLGDLWRIFLEEVAAERGMTPERLDEYAQRFPDVMAAAAGDTAKAALDFGLVDQALTRVESRERLVAMVGEDEDSHSYNQVAFADYLKTIDDDRFGRDAKGDKVGVVVARGSILDGSQPAGAIGGDSTAKLIRQARDDDAIKAIVLRVDSGGGSAFASEVIRRECEATRAAGKPVVASMGSVAASGGYWISTSADQIWAHPGTVTGSIGILAIFPTYQRPLAEHLGIHVDGIATAPLAGVRPDRALPPEIGGVIQSAIDHGYREFLERVAASRGMTTEEVDRIARGRVWSGQDAHSLGLVDHLGTLGDAIAAAAELAELGEDYAVSYVEPEEKLKDRILRRLTAEAVAAAAAGSGPPSPLERALRAIEREAAEIGELNDPGHVYAWSGIATD
ncbi:MAG: signal peptide peptidase SppA [Thermoanaerobaculales bacterium]|nr:signal peptide peptidase SppA [Thermoanaerobaculales bacterium]